MFNEAYCDRRVLITGHTGFKGSWLAYWLRDLGASVVGFALDPPTQPNHYDLLKLDIDSVIGDVRDSERLAQTVREFRPDIVFHLAAQPLVRQSYAEPAETMATNVQGTVNLYEACRRVESVRAIVCVTTDKVYEERDWVWGFRENDRLGGFDPYSCSKACAELVTNCYRNAFWPLREHGRRHQTLIASARAGNVIGGGDWAADRLVADVVRAAQAGAKTILRNPGSVRPWQHVLEPLAGYLQLGDVLLQGRTDFAKAWNFGPDEADDVTVERVVKEITAAWPRVTYVSKADPNAPHENRMLHLNCEQARRELDWSPVWDWRTAVHKTAEWYREYIDSGQVLTGRQLEEYVECARGSGVSWGQA